MRRGQMEGSGPQQCQHTGILSAHLQLEQAGLGVERAKGARGGAEMAAAPPGGLCWCQELPGHTWCQTGEQTHSRRSWGSPRLHRTPVWAQEVFRGLDFFLIPDTWDGKTLGTPLGSCSCGTLGDTFRYLGM